AMALLLVAALGLMVLWRLRNERFLQAQLVAEHEGRVQAERFEHLMRAAADVVLVMDSQGRVLEANERAFQMYGWTPADLKSKAFADLHAPEARDELSNRLAALRDCGRLLFETVHQRSDGTRFPVEVNASCFPVDGTPFELAIVRDITQRRRAEEERTRLVTAMNQAAESIVITDVKGTIQFVNPAFEQITGYTRSEAVGRTPRLLKSGKQDAAFYRELWRTLVQGDVWRGHFVNRRKDGTLFEEEATISPVRDAVGKIVSYVAIKLDVTRQKQLEARLLRSQRLESVGALASGISHDLNNILAPLLMIVPLLRDRVPDEECREQLDIIESSARRGADIVRQLLTFARGQPGQRVPVPLKYLLQDLHSVMRETFPRDVRSEVRVASDLWPMMGDPTQVQQALLNLCVNARDAMPGGGKLLLEADNVTLAEGFATTVLAARSGPYVRLGVTDTGSGIAPENLERIFEPFFTTKEIGKGTGLGLATVLGIMQGNQGCIRVTTRVDQGTVFELYFPACPEARVPVSGTPQRPMTRGRGEVILVVDDEPALRDGLRRMLEAHGYGVITASQGEEGLAEFRRHRGEIAAVLTDAMMPVMGGAALVRAVRALAPELPVIVATGLADHESLKSLLSREEALLMVKPFSGEELLATLDGVLRHSLPRPTENRS
ncbi:MAG: PAS domain S-box protein, partial [Verrucomicrobiales bacterium]|nr:PAS domain S-box protein [Verrucomicrobiales bacterium]